MRLLDMPRFDSDAIVTVHQFSDYFWRNCPAGIEKHLESLADEVLSLDALQSTNTSLVCQTIQSQSGVIPRVDWLHLVTALFCSSNRQLQGAITNYLSDVSKDEELRGKVIDILIDGLESENSIIRQGTCATLAVLKAKECINQLTYLSQTDDSVSVRNAAKAALMTFGPEGRKAYDQTQLSSLGFQGLKIH